MPCLRSHMKTDNANRLTDPKIKNFKLLTIDWKLADPENLYIPGFKGILKISQKKIRSQVAAILIIGGELKISILMGNFA